MERENVICVQRYHAPCGDLWLGALGSRLCLCNWVVEKHPGRVDKRLQRLLKATCMEAPSEVVREAAVQLDEYFRCERTVFSIPLLLAGSDFQKFVWGKLADIPYGKTVSYGELAGWMGRPKAVRAVANANGANALSIFLPCHRVVGSDRSLTGYGGGLAAKKFLLELERQGKK